MALPHSNKPLDYPARFQWQSGAPCSGRSCCTDTVIQMIVEYYKEKTYSLAYIRKMAESKTSFNEAPCTGINYVEVLNALKIFGINHYRKASGIDASFVLKKLATGPVLVGVHYGSYPKNTNGRCGSTNKAEYSGKTDCPFTGAHAVLAVGRRQHLDTKGKLLHTDVLVRDPDHHSATRPEAPKFDRIKGSQLNKAMLALAPNTAFSSSYCIYPTIKK